MWGSQYDSSVLPVPSWDDLPEYAQSALKKTGYDQLWVGKVNLTPTEDHFLTVLNMLVKLAGMKLWNFVGEPIRYSVGSIEFRAATMDGLRAALAQRSDFSTPDANPDDWESREHRMSGSLHFKHHKKWHDDEEHVEAHMDQAGARCGGALGAACYPVQGQLHVHEYMRGKIKDRFPEYDAHDYRNVRDLRQILLDQGWDPAPLVGVSRVKRPKE
jgi:hypothetical protein